MNSRLYVGLLIIVDCKRLTLIRVRIRSWRWHISLLFCCWCWMKLVRILGCCCGIDELPPAIGPPLLLLLFDAWWACWDCALLVLFVLPVVDVEVAFALGLTVLMLWLMFLFAVIDAADMELFDMFDKLVEPAFKNIKRLKIDFSCEKTVILIPMLWVFKIPWTTV